MQLNILLTVIWLWFTCRVSYAATIYVDSNSTAAAAGCGQNPATACKTIADGFNAATTADNIDIQPGLYTGEGNENLESINFTATQLVISGSTGNPIDVVIMCSSPNRFLAADVQLYSIIRDLTIRNCSSLVTTADTVGSGGALLLAGVNSAVVISNVVFFGNKARNGGAIFLEGGSLTLRNCLFDANEAQYWGGAVNSIDSGLTVESTVMRGNKAHGDLGDSQVNVNTDQAGKGGAVHGNGGSRLSLLASEFTDNSAKLSGGAVFLNLVSGLTVLDCLFHSNTAAGGDACSSDQVCQVRGGGIYVKDVAVTMTNSSFIANSAITQDLSQYAEGGAIVFATDVFSNDRIESYISNCSFVNNTARGAGENNAGGYGGAVFSRGIPVSITRSDFVGNYVQSDGLFTEYASGGGAVYIASSAAGEIIDSVFSRNFADGGRAGAVYITESSVILMHNNTFTLNAAYSSYVVKGQGGAVGIGQKSTGQIESCRFLNNFASPKLDVYPKTYSGFGGALFSQSSSGTVSDCYFAANTADSGQFDSGGQGGAIGLENTRDFNIYSSVFLLNSARGFYGTNSYSSSGAGGAVCLLFSSTTFTDCLFLDNFASAGGSQYSIGGGVAIFYEYSSDGVSDAPLAFTNCKFVRNVAGGEMCAHTPVYRAGQGGGLGVVGVSAEDVVINMTSFEENMAMTESGGLVSSYGGGIMYAQGSSVICNDCVFNKNLAWNGLGDDVCSGLDDVSYSTVLDLKLSRPVLHSANDIEAFKIHERFLLLKSAFCVELSQDILPEGNPVHVLDALAGGSDLRRSIRDIRRDVSTNHHPWNEMFRRHLSLMSTATGPYSVEDMEESSRGRWLPFSAGRTEEVQNGGHADDLMGLEFTQSSHRGRRLADVKSRIYPSMLFLSGTASIYLPMYNNSYEICVGDLVSIIVGLTEGTGVPSVTSSGKTPALTVIGSINSSDLVLVAVSANITVVDQSPRSSIALRSLGLLNSTLFFSNNVSVDQGGAFIGSTLSSFVPANISNVTVDKSYMPVLNMLGDVFTGLGSGEHTQSGLEIIDLLKRTTHEPTTKLERCTLRIYGNLYLSTVSANSSDPKTVSIYLTSNSTMILTRGAQLFSVSPAEIIAETARNVALINFGTMYLAGSKPSYLHQLRIFGVLIQLDPGMLIFSISNENYMTPALVASTNVSLLGTINITAYSSTLYKPSSDTDNATEWRGLEFTTVSASRDDENVTRYVYPTGIYFSDTISSRVSVPPQADGGSGEYSEELLQKEISYASAVVARGMAARTVDDTSYTQVFTTSAMSCEQRYTKYDTNGETDLDYMCFVCLMNHSCGFCDRDGCVDKGESCSSGGPKRDDNCCPQMCHNHGRCEHSDGYTSFWCECDFFWDGNSCSTLSRAAYFLIGAGVFIVVIGLITLRYYYYYRQQKKKVLQELRVGLLNGNTDDSGGSENRSYLQAIQQDLILRDVFVNYSEIQFEGKIGEGSFGEVFKASFRGAQVAVKQMRAPVFMQLTENDIEEFRTEAYMMSRLRHPNIVLVMGVSIVSLVLPGPPPGFDDDDNIGDSGVPASEDKRRRSSKSSSEKKDEKVVRSICIITEYLEQGSLADILYGSSKVPGDIWTYELVLTCALQAARGMLYLHSHQPPICHRDLKSSNLVVDDHWVVKVTDFGMSRIVPMKIQNIEKGIEKSNSVDLMGVHIDRADILSAALAAEAESARATDAADGDGNSKKSVTINEDANTSWERESIISPEEGERHSQSNTLMTSNLGTTAWCAPELLTATNKTRYSVKVDVYSFGMVLWELWERKRPYEELYSRFDIIDAVREGRRPAISSTCPPAFRSLIQRCWHEQPARRPTFAYIVRYIKDELAHIKRQRMSSASSFSPLHQLLLGSRTKSNTSGGTVSSPDAPVLSENTSSSQSVDDVREKNWLQRGPAEKEQEIQSQAVTSRSTITSYMPPTASHLPPAPLAIPQKPSQESLDMLASSPWANGSEVPDMPSGIPPQRQSVHLGAAASTWRDKYVMRFSGWKSSDPDTGLPPSVYGSGGLGASNRTENMDIAVAAPAPTGRGGSDSPDSRSQESSLDSNSDEVGVGGTVLPAQGAYELDLYSSSSTICPEDLPRLPAVRASDGSSRDGRASGGGVQPQGDSSES